MPVTIETCIKCKKLFHYAGFGTKFCPKCRDEDEKIRARIKEFLRENGMANMYEISVATGVPEKMIKQYLKEGMLEIPEGSPIYLKCESCGCDIRSGRWCPACATRMSNELKGTFIAVGDVPKVPVMKGKMRFLDRNRGK